MSQTVRAKDIAERLGVARPTVSTILSGGKSNTRVSAALRERVLKTAREMGYRPNAAAKAISTGKFGCVGLVLSAADPGRSSVPGDMLWGASSELEKHGMHLTIATLDDVQLTDEDFVPKILREWTADGLLLNYQKLVPERMIELIETYRIPSIWLNVKRDHDCVHFDDMGAARQATQRLLDLGHRRIAFASHHWEGPASHYSEHDRRDGYIDVMREAGMKVDVFDQLTFGRDRPYEEHIGHWVERFSKAGRPTAVLVYGGHTVLTIARAADRAGLSVPRDLSLITFGVRSAKLGAQLADTMVHDEEQYGRVAVGALLKKIKSPSTDLAPRVLKMEYVEGSTVSRPPSDA